jgi:hypothetical protein
MEVTPPMKITCTYLPSNASYDEPRKEKKIVKPRILNNNGSEVPLVVRNNLPEGFWMIDDYKKDVEENENLVEVG